jgi:hypothetical protein
MFWFKKKKIILKCYTTDPFAYSFAKIDWGENFIPEWYSNLPVYNTWPNGSVEPTLRVCHGFKQLYKNSLVIPSWAHISMTPNSIQDGPGFDWKSNTTFTHISSHHSNQIAGFCDDTLYSTFKIETPWWIQCNRPVQFIVSDPVWSRSGITDYCILPGIVDFKYQTSTNILGLLEHRQERREISFSPGDPLVFLTPMTEEDIVLEYHLVTFTELQKHLPDLRVGVNGAINKYVTRKKFINKLDQRESKCPFGFKKD